ncbi:hypothetical protein MFLO_00280 [Listeria floridensis FSL S10-1187]|uniref:Mor transcription activator domain-containing protein n=1 Tax=Listeria floridensis FSL S10-1187 TaxID=1265817 RepID=A0ABN0RIB4_9LIST|nr:CD3324 family protein [Listeria floridensis]EUJ33644.1 hypothetical protein MFLO_00280 [Listeria floridensis FSL S10-1187]
MKYQSVQDILPEKLIAEIQNYIEGTVLYIPTRKKTSWGEKSGTRAFIKERNKAIKSAFANGSSIKELANQHFLSESTIKNYRIS